MAFDIDKSMQPNVIEILPLVTEKKGIVNLDFITLEKLTSHEFVNDVKKDFESGQNLSGFTCEVKKVISSHRDANYCDRIYVNVGHFIYSHIYCFPISSKRSYNRDQDLLILNHDYYMEVIEPFMKKVDKKLIWKRR